MASRYHFYWNAENVELPMLDYEKLQIWINEVALAHNKRLGDIAYIFCDDEKILDVNREFLKHDYYTDIITFDYSTRSRISGDMYISLDTVRTNAEQFDSDYDRELLRVIIHGILHLCGIDDKGPGEREIMERHENEALAMFDDIQLPCNML